MFATGAAAEGGHSSTAGNFDFGPGTASAYEEWLDYGKTLSTGVDYPWQERGWRIHDAAVDEQIQRTREKSGDAAALMLEQAMRRLYWDGMPRNAAERSLMDRLEDAASPTMGDKAVGDFVDWGEHVVERANETIDAPAADDTTHELHGSDDQDASPPHDVGGNPQSDDP